MPLQIIKFVITGLLNTCIDFGVFNLLLIITGAQSPQSIALINTLAVSMAIANSYILNRHWTFAADKRKGQLQRFIIASLIGIIINSSSVILFARLLGGSDFSSYLLLNTAKILGAALSTVWNFLAYRNWVFSVNKSQPLLQLADFQPGLISIIIPAYNEEQRLPSRLRHLAATIAGHFPLEILVVDDGSRDHTLEQVRNVACEYPFIRCLTQPCNQGKGAAVRSGMAQASGEYLLFTDADDTYTPEHLIMVIDNLMQGHAAVIACRQGRGGERLAGESFWRCWQGRIFNALVQLLLLPGIKDSQCGLKGFHRQAAAQIFPRQRISGFAFDVELLALLRSINLPITELKVSGVDCPGSTVRRWLTPLTMARDVLRIKLALLFNLYDLPGQFGWFRRGALAGGLFLLALLLRVPWLWEVPRYVDELKEVQLAYQIYQGQAWPLHNAAHDIGALHNYILAGIFKLLGSSIYWPRLYVAVTSALTVVLIYYIGKKLYGQWVGITAALLLAGNGMHILVTHMAWSNCTTPFFFSLAFWALLQAEEKHSGIWLMISAFWWALTLQTHSSVIIYVLAATFYVLRPDFRHQAAIKTKYYWLAAFSFLLAYANMIYFNILSRGGSLVWLRYKGYALEKEIGITSYLQNLQAMFIELLRSLSSSYLVHDELWNYLSHPWFSLSLLLLVVGTIVSLRQKKYLPLYIMASAFLIMPWINHRYVFFLATRYIMPVMLCALLLIALAIQDIFSYIYGQLGTRCSLMVPAMAGLLLLMLLEVVPFYNYCAQTAGTNQSNRLALQVFQKTMELSDHSSTLVVLDKNIKLENDPLPYLLSLAGQPYLVGNADLLTNRQSGKTVPNNYPGKKVVGIVSASKFRSLRPGLAPQGIDSYSCKLTMPASARGERKIYVLDMGYNQNSGRRK